MQVCVQTLHLGDFRVELEPSAKVSDLRKHVAVKLKLPAASVKLVAKGEALDDEDPCESVSEENGEVVLALAAPKPVEVTPQLRNTTALARDAENEDDLDFRLPENVTIRRAAHFLHDRLHVPEFVLTLLCQVKPAVWLGIFAWLLFAPLASRLGVGELYVLATVVCLIFLNLGQRKEGEASAYSIFNGFRRLPGQLTADELDRQVRTGRM